MNDSQLQGARSEARLLMETMPSNNQEIQTYIAKTARAMHDRAKIEHEDFKELKKYDEAHPIIEGVTSNTKIVIILVILAAVVILLFTGLIPFKEQVEHMKIIKQDPDFRKLAESLYPQVFQSFNYYTNKIKIEDKCENISTHLNKTDIFKENGLFQEQSRFIDKWNNTIIVNETIYRLAYIIYKGNQLLRTNVLITEGIADDLPVLGYQLYQNYSNEAVFKEATDLIESITAEQKDNSNGFFDRAAQAIQQLGIENIDLNGLRELLKHE